MTTPTAHDIFWLARYAHRQLTPYLAPLDARLQIVLDIETKYPGVALWLFPGDFKDPLVAHRTSIKTKDQVDQFVVEVKLLASIAA